MVSKLMEIQELLKGTVISKNGNVTDNYACHISFSDMYKVENKFYAWTEDKLNK